MRRYELMLLIRPDLEDDKLQAAVEKVTRAVVNGGGALTKVSPWGKRRLAYEIKHFREASYFLIHFDIAPDAVREIERGLLISEEILRHLVTVLSSQPGEVDDDDLPLPEDELVAVEDSLLEPELSEDDLPDDDQEVHEDEVAAEAQPGGMRRSMR